MDLILSAIAILLFITLVIVLIPIVSNRSASAAIYGGQAFTNIENLRFTNPAWAFLQDYRVDEGRLDAFFAQSYDTVEINLLSNIENFDVSTSDVCVFFLDNTPPVSRRVAFAGADTFGQMYDSPAHTTRQRCDWVNPCQFYSQSFVYVKPVLRQSTIVTMYLRVCTV